eukprot:CAMPEP_0201727516 /NCGR_PEP_ID=MMETSP0593-20130828/12545_1 /ASSEMBLY_ACC=CAM_ASM_000672 /TAXON_ID=267983 /ORGANISM="Skeletonema japonicum, Strain CCMP2506" /LENGTH=500 /DNA_ID=CAMNT_0048219349 /DNA_START=67 /DNA_END=1569 /DNA_ORIENTATION=-
MEAFLGPEPAMYIAEMLLRVIDVAFDKGHPDPRHSEHWWDWRDWPFDGRQWTYEGTINRYKLDKKDHAEWKRRQNFSVGSGIKEGSGLHIERKLEGGMLWGEKKFPEGRTCIRSSTKVVCPPSYECVDDFMVELFKEATDLDKRLSYDAAIKRDKPIKALPVRDEFSQEVAEHVGCSADVLTMKYFGCTDAFATRGEQNGEDNAPSLMIGATVPYEGFQNLIVVAEIPLRPMGMDMFVEACHDRIAGFLFCTDDDSEEGSSSSNAVNVTYVESCQYDLDTLDHNEKDALLEDRALTVHRLLKSIPNPGVDTQHLLSDVSFPRHLPDVKPDAGFSLPPQRTLSLMNGVHRADPRWPLVKPNSVCLECGKDPTSAGGKLLHCSKCGVRHFCSSKCMATSWRSDTWSHKNECTSWCQMQQSQVGKSIEDTFKELVADGHIMPRREDGAADEALSMLQRRLGKSTLTEKYDSVEEMRDGQRQRAKETRKAKREGKKGKKKGKKK